MMHRDISSTTMVPSTSEPSVRLSQRTIAKAPEPMSRPEIRITAQRVAMVFRLDRHSYFSNLANI